MILKAFLLRFCKYIGKHQITVFFKGKTIINIIC